MNILVFDKDTRKYKGNISQIVSLIWTERYWECGDFELVLPLSLNFYSKFQLGDYFKISTSNTIMIVEQVEVTSAINTTEGSINVKGRSLESILDRRVLLKEFEKDTHPSVYIPQLVTECFTGEGRTVDYLTIRQNSNIIVDENEDEDEEDKLSISASRGDNLYSLVNSAAVAAEIGFRILFDNNDGTMIFLLYEGSDKTYMRFSELSLTLNEANFYRSIEQHRNYIMVDGKNNDDTDRTIIVYDHGDLDVPPTGLSRRELVLDYSVGKYENESDKKYDKRLKLKGNEALEEYKEVKTAEGKIISVGKWKIRKDFDLGDIVTLHNDYFTAEARITEIIQSWDYADGYQIYPGFILKDIKLSTIRSEYETPVKPEPDEPVPETPDIPIDQTPKKLINVEIISGIKLYTNFIVNGNSRTYHQIYIPNYDPSDPDNRPIKRFGVRLRGLLPEGWDASLYSIYCDIFLGSEQKLETIKVTFNPGDMSFIGNWYSYLTYDSPYIRLYLYVVANEIGYVDIPDDQEPFINGLVDIRLNNVDQVYIPSEEGDQLTCQTTYIWENNGNFHRYCSTNSTNITGISDVDITVLRHNSMGNKSMLTELENVIDSGKRLYEYDTVSLDNIELTPIETGMIEVPPTGGMYDIPAVATQFENEVIGNFGWRQSIAEVIKSSLEDQRLVTGSNTQEMSLLFKKRKVADPNPKKLLNLTMRLYAKLYGKITTLRYDNANATISLHIDNSKRYVKNIKFIPTPLSFYFTNVIIYGDKEKKIEHLFEESSKMNTEIVNFYDNDSIDIIIEQEQRAGKMEPDFFLTMIINETVDEGSYTIDENYDIDMIFETYYSTDDVLYNNGLSFSFLYFSSTQIDSRNDVIESVAITGENMDTALPYDFSISGQSYNGLNRVENFCAGAYQYLNTYDQSYMFYSDSYSYPFTSYLNPNDLKNYQNYISDFPKNISASIPNVKEYIDSTVDSSTKSYGFAINRKEEIATGKSQIREKKTFDTKYYIKYSYSKEVR